MSYEVTHTHTQSASSPPLLTVVAFRVSLLAAWSLTQNSIGFSSVVCVCGGGGALGSSGTKGGPERDKIRRKARAFPPAHKASVMIIIGATPDARMPMRRNKQQRPRSGSALPGPPPRLASFCAAAFCLHRIHTVYRWCK